MITMDGCPRPEKPVKITRFDPPSAPAAELSEYVRVQLAASSVDEQAEPGLTGDSALARLTRRPSPDQHRIHWVARVPEIAEPIGVARLTLFGAADSDLAAIDITVHPGQRRPGSLAGPCLAWLPARALDRRSAGEPAGLLRRCQERDQAGAAGRDEFHRTRVVPAARA
jgi:hypothetical protein